MWPSAWSAHTSGRFRPAARWPRESHLLPPGTEADPPRDSCTTDDSTARLVLVDSVTGTAREVDTDIDIGEPIGAASWTGDGQWLVFGGIRHTFALARGGDRPVPLPYAAGYEFIASLEP